MLESNFTNANSFLVVYWLVFFSIVVHGLSIPLLNVIYKWLRIPVVHDHPVEILLLSENEPVPNNSVVDQRTHHVTVNNRFSRMSHHNIGPELGTHHPGELDTITVILRSGDHDRDDYSLSRTSTKGSPRPVEQAVAGEMV
jgi:sodium/hydrogen antiporter